MIPTDPETLHVFAVDLSMSEAAALADDGEALSRALGGIEVEPDRAEALDTRALGDIGLSAYLAEGEGVQSDQLRQDAAMLDAHKGPVMILRPHAIGESPRPQEPLRHLGSYRLSRGAPVGAPLRSASAEPSATGVAPAPPSPGSNDKRMSGLVALLAVVAALLVVVIVWLVAV